VLDVGCGTGTLVAALVERAHCKAWGIDAAPEMLEVARRVVPRGVGLKLARAESLPFADGWFERVTMSLVAHVLDRDAAFAEARRVLRADGRLVVASFDRAHFAEYWLNPFFPSIRVVDDERFPSAEQLERELRAAGFADVRATTLRQRKTVPRDEALEKIRGRHISSFDLIPDAEYEEGLARAERELPDLVEYGLVHLVVVGAVRPPL
jgi:ubiquinone/menaquinone biosynthesis C-methylase UbiE